jgi:hypothetical protein
VFLTTDLTGDNLQNDKNKHANAQENENQADEIVKTGWTFSQHERHPS